MSQEELYLFDLTGYLVVEDALTQEAVATANQAIDQERDKIRLRPQDQRMDGVIPNTCAGNMTGMNWVACWSWIRPGAICFASC